MISNGLTSPASTAAVPKISVLTSPSDEPIMPGMRMADSLIRANTATIRRVSSNRLMGTLVRLCMMLVSSVMGMVMG